MIVGLALLSAFVFGSGVAFQQRAAVDAPVADAARPRLLLRLTHSPAWLIGLGADVIGFGIQAWALHRGSLVVVQPLIATSLLFTLGFIALVEHEAISLGEWTAVGIVLLGLSLFLVAGSPGQVATGASDVEGWLLCTLSVCLVVGCAVAAGLRAHGLARAGWFGLAAGVGDAFMAVLAKAFADSFGHGAPQVLLTWSPYALVIGGLTTMLLVSTAYQAGHPTVSLPIIAVAEPFFSSVIGLALFNERLRLEGLRGPLVAFAIVLMGGGLILLGRDERLAGQRGPDWASGDGQQAAVG